MPVSRIRPDFITLAAVALTAVTLLPVSHARAASILPFKSEEATLLVGVDAPESVTPDRPVGCFGPQSAAAARRLMPGAGRTARCAD